MKEYIDNLPTLTSPVEGETLFIYLEASKECISTVLVSERERIQVPIYFVSRVLQGAEMNYPELEKLTLALVHTARKLRRYFQAHQIVVLTNKPTRQVLLKPEKSGRMAKWAIELEWKLYTDAALSFDGSWAGLMLVNPEGKKITYALRFEFATTNNEAEYKALLAGLRMAKELKILYLLTLEDDVTWMTPLQVYLEAGILPEDKNEASKIRIKAPSYKMMNGALYRRSFLTSWLRCVGPKQATVIIQEMHAGICGLHAGPRSIVAKIIGLGYYWPTMHHDATIVLQTCESCQIYSNIPRLLKQELVSVTSAWPFMKWGIDIVRPINDTPGSPRFLLVAIDYFTNWAEAKPLTAIIGKQVEKFVWEHIVCRFGVP
ncbi:uncharacterized protein [Rutidosis leptorrhynchoides]|uniref:uncharacterized protein n=1 Tax=Rutidosis leptorrhynchoides TaxID=125765 RepID=UPI003A991825